VPATGDDSAQDAETPGADDRDPPDVPVIDRLRKGYFGIPPPPRGVRFPSDTKSDPVLAWTMALDAAKKGSFIYMPRMFELYDPAGDYIFNRQIVVLMGDAGPTRYFQPIVKELQEPTDPIDYEVAIDFSFALSIRGRLGDVPLMLDTFMRHSDVEDADIIPVHISTLLVENPEELPGPEDWPSLEEYFTAVMNLCRDRVSHFGSEDVLVLGGKRFGVISMARRILQSLKEPYFSPNFRRRFEASTGIDCTRFFNKAGVVQPLDAAALVEDFLESEKSVAYEEGIRYFFGHRIPD